MSNIENMNVNAGEILAENESVLADAGLTLAENEPMLVQADVTPRFNLGKTILTAGLIGLGCYGLYRAGRFAVRMIKEHREKDDLETVEENEPASEDFYEEDHE